MKLKVTDGYQINQGGKIHAGGQSLEATAAEAGPWIAAGWAEEVKEKKADKSQAKEEKAQAKEVKAESKEIQRPQSGTRAESKEVQRPFGSATRPSSKY